MKFTSIRIAMIAIGAIGLVIVYSLRPPAGFADAFNAMARGQAYFLPEPIYFLGLVLFGGIAAIGIYRAMRAG